MQLSRVRVLVGLLTVSVGTVWATGGVSALAGLGWSFLRALPAVTFGLGITLLIRALAPKGLMVGPFLLIAVGAIALGLQFGKMPTVDIVRLLPWAIVVIGVLVALIPPSSLAGKTPVERRLSLFAARRVQLTGEAPAKLILRSILGGIYADLTRCTYPRGVWILTVDVTQLGGRVELCVPRAWHVRAGRIELARGIRFNGELDSAEPPPLGRTAESAELVAVNVQGLGGAFTITRPHTVPAESAASLGASAESAAGSTPESSASSASDPPPDTTGC